MSFVVPPSPPFLYVTSATSHSVLLHWKQGDDGAAQILGYTLYYKKAHGETEEITLSRRTTSYELKGLQCGSTYSISLSSFNKLGSSPASQSLPVRTQGQMPGTPAPSTFLQPNSTSVTLKLHVWPENGCPLLSFTVRYKTVNDMEWLLGWYIHDIFVTCKVLSVYTLLGNLLIPHASGSWLSVSSHRVECRPLEFFYVDVKFIFDVAIRILILETYAI